MNFDLKQGKKNKIYKFISLLYLHIIWWLVKIYCITEQFELSSDTNVNKSGNK